MQKWYERGMRPVALVVALALSLTAGCASPAPPPPVAHVAAPHVLRVRLEPGPGRINYDFQGATLSGNRVDKVLSETDEAIARFDRALADALRRAGYEVTYTDPGDVQIVRQLVFVAEPRQARHGVNRVNDIDRAILRVTDTKGSELDRFVYRASDPEPSENVAAELVNQMVGSRNLTRYAEDKKREATQD